MYKIFVLVMLVIECIRFGVNVNKANDTDRVIEILIGLCLMCWMIAMIAVPPV